MLVDSDEEHYGSSDMADHKRDRQEDLLESAAMLMTRIRYDFPASKTISALSFVADPSAIASAEGWYVSLWRV